MTAKSNINECYSSRNKRINILLEHFHFYHQPSSDEDVDPKYISRQNPEHQLRNWLEKEETHHGVYLITGYRGMGKSSLVGKVLNDLKKEKDKSKKKDRMLYKTLQVNLGQENINEKEILRTIAKMLFDVYEKLPSKAKWMYQCAVWLYRFISIVFSIEIVGILIGNDFFVNLWDNMGSVDLSRYLELMTQSEDWDWTKIIKLLYLAGAWLASYLFKRQWGKAKMPAGLKRLKTLCERLNATVSYERKFEWLQKFGFSRKQSQNLDVATMQEIEYELIQVLDILKEKRKNLKFVIILDELDKAEPAVEGSGNKNDILDYGKVAATPSHHVTSRERRQEVLRIIANMKFFLTTAQAYFIFIAGRELYEAFQADMSDRDFSLSSIFSNVLNVDSFLISTRKTNNTALMTEQFICKQLLPENIKDVIVQSNNRNLYDEKNLYSLKNYYNYRTENNLRSDVIMRDVMFLYHFTHYLSYISNGSPKKMSMFFEKNIRDYDYLEDNDKLEDLSPDMPKGYYLSFGYYTQQKINFIHYLTYPVMQTIINMSNMYGDKLLVSASFLVSHIYKFHNNGFSWRNLELTPELQEINKTPEIREFISSIIDYLNHTHLTAVPCGLYHYKFPMHITEEISYFSKVSSEISSLFNFSLDQLKALKEHYMNLLSYATQTNNPTLYNQESVHHSLGDIYMMEENYSKAIWEYDTCVNMIRSGKNTDSKGLNDVLFLTRTLLKLGLAHEKRRTDNSAFVVYESLIVYLKEMKRRPVNQFLFEDIRIMCLAILAKLYVLEKLDTDGIQAYHIDRALNDFEELMDSKIYPYNFYNVLSKKDKEIVSSDFYRKLGDILYYKNPKNLNGRVCSAYDAYVKSLDVLNMLSVGNDKNLLARSILAKSFEMVGIYSDIKDQRQDNYLYNIALASESLGHVSFSEFKKPESDETNLEYYHENFFKKLLECLVSSKEAVRKKAIEDIEVKNSMERSILYYLSASRFYNASCERGLSSRCYKEVMLVLSSYMNVFRENGEVPGDAFVDFLDRIVHLLLISKYHQYEHIHLSEINTLKWMQGRELYQYVELGDLSISPDIEEIVYAYYMIKLDLANFYEKAQSDKQAENVRNSLIRFYKSRLMSGQMMCCTLTSSILNLRLKACLNEFLLARLLKCKKEDLVKITLEDLVLYQERKDIFGDDMWIRRLFNFGETKSQFDRNFDVLEFLISDGHFCLSRILEKIIPLRNTTLFNNSFKGDIYYHLIRFTHLYKQLYCYYSYGHGHDAKKERSLDVYLSNSKIEGWNFPDGRLVATTRSTGDSSVTLYSVNHPADINQRRLDFLKRMTYASKRSNPSKTIKVYLAENAIHYYTKAWQVHHQGKSYQMLIRNLHFLDDDLNNNTCQFYMATERFLIQFELIKERIEELKGMYKDSYYYNVDSYFVVHDNH